MATVTAGMTVSLDGFVADPQGSASRLYRDLADLRGTDYMNTAIEQTGAVVMGRRTFEMGDPDPSCQNEPRLPPREPIAERSPGRRRRRDAAFSAGRGVHVGDTGLPLEDTGALQLDVLGTEGVEETAPLAEQHRDEMCFELVEDAGSERELRGSGAVDQHVLVARSPLGLGHRGADIVHVGDQRPLPRFAVGLTSWRSAERRASVSTSGRR